eukprot:m.182782 g.182782  ORF g.182782 m.182782 type:complete len:75 (+) comp39295_c0_seq57:2646-2870(+)
MELDIELLNLYLKLFKLVFGSVSLFAQENEQMLKVLRHLISQRQQCQCSLVVLLRLEFALPGCRLLKLSSGTPG